MRPNCTANVLWNLDVEVQPVSQALCEVSDSLEQNEERGCVEPMHCTLIVSQNSAHTTPTLGDTRVRQRPPTL